MTPSGLVVTCPCVGAFGFCMSSEQAPSVTTESAATATAPCFMMRMGMSPRSEGEPRAQRPRARDGVAAEIEAAVGSGGLHRADAAGIGAEEVDLRVIAAVLRPDVEVAAGQRDIDSVAEVA